MGGAARAGGETQVGRHLRTQNKASK